MIKVLLSDFSRVLLFPKDSLYQGGLNDLYKKVLKSNFKFWDFFELNSELLNYYKSLTSVKLAIFTSEIIQEAPELRVDLESFKDIFSGQRLRIDKAKPEAYELLLEKLGAKPGEVVYIDDNLVNIKAAKAAGLLTIAYQDNKQIISALSSLLQGND